MEEYDGPSQIRQRTHLPAKLVFDTAGRLMSSGARLRQATSRHLLFEVEDFCLDLRLDRPPQAAAVLVGQLADRKDPLKPLAGLPVYLVAGDRFLARTTSNRLGEFQVEYEPEDAMSLCLALGTEHLIEVPMDPPVDDAPT